METIKRLKIASMFPLGFMLLVLLLFGIGEMVTGDLSGLSHVIPALVVELVIWLCWKRALWGGILLEVGALLATLAFLRALVERSPMWFWPVILLIIPLAISGLLMLWAGWMERKAA